MKILIASNDKASRDSIRAVLLINDHEIIEARDGLEALDRFHDVQLVILETVLPCKDSLQVCREIREKSSVPIIFIASGRNECDIIAGLSAGGDDYIVKPYSSMELLARVHSLLRRWYFYRPDCGNCKGETAVTIGDITLRDKACKALVLGREIPLTEKEYKILKLLCSEAGSVLSAQRIYEHVWTEPFFYSARNTVMVHIRKLRQKIEKDPQDPQYIKTVWGSGYRIGIEGE